MLVVTALRFLLGAAGVYTSMAELSAGNVGRSDGMPPGPAG